MLTSSRAHRCACATASLSRFRNNATFARGRIVQYPRIARSNVSSSVPISASAAEANTARIIVQGRHLPLTPAIKEYAESKVMKVYLQGRLPMLWVSSVFLGFCFIFSPSLSIYSVCAKSQGQDLSSPSLSSLFILMHRHSVPSTQNPINAIKKIYSFLMSVRLQHLFTAGHPQL